MRPLLLEHGDEDEVELVEQGLLLAQRLFGARALDDELNDEVSDSYAKRLVRYGDCVDIMGKTNLGTVPEGVPSTSS